MQVWIDRHQQPTKSKSQKTDILRVVEGGGIEMIPKCTRGNQRHMDANPKDLSGSGRWGSSSGTAESEDDETYGISPKIRSEGEGFVIETNDWQMEWYVAGF